MKKIVLLIIMAVYAFSVDVGVLLPLTGSTSNYGEYAKRGLELAVKDNKDINLIYVDTKGSKIETATATERLISKHKVDVIIGEVSSTNTIVAGSIAEKHKVPLITPTATNTAITNKKEYVMRACFDDAFQGQALAKFTMSIKPKSLIIITDTAQSYSVGLTKEFKKVYKGEYKEFIIQTGDVDFTAIVSRLKPDDVIFFSGYYKEVALMLNKMSTLNKNNTIIAGDAVGFNETAEIGGKASDNVYFGAQYNMEDLSSDFAKEYTSKYNEPPETYSALSYDTVNLVADAINSCVVPNSECINKALHESNYTGVSGLIKIDVNGNTVKDMVVNKFQSGKIEFVRIYKSN